MFSDERRRQADLFLKVAAALKHEKADVWSSRSFISTPQIIWIFCFVYQRREM